MPYRQVLELLQDLKEFKDSLLYKKYIQDQNEVLDNYAMLIEYSKPTPEGQIELQRNIGQRKSAREHALEYWDRLEHLLTELKTQHEHTRNRPN